jgi:HK97 family phage major capsid protein
MKELLVKRAKAFEEARAIVLKAEQEQRALTAEERSKYDTIMTDVTAMGETIERSRQSDDLSHQLDQSVGPRPGSGNPRANPGTDKVDAAFDCFLRRGIRELTAEQRGLFAPTPGYQDGIQLRAASPLSDYTGTAGAYTVPQGFVQQLEVAMKWFGGMRQSRAQVFKTTTGNPLPWPSMNDTNNTGELIAENTAVTQASTEMSFNHVLFNGWKYSSKLVLVPIELLQDSAFDVQAFVAEALGIRLGRIQNNHFTVGTGSSQPTGVVTGATQGVVGATGSTTSISYNNLVDLVHSVDPAYRVGAQFMFHDSVAQYIEKLVDNNGRPLLNSSLAGISGDVKAGQPGVPSYTILGYPVVINNDMATMAANAESALFGDFTRYKIREVMDLMLVRFGETYMASGQIGFLCFMRSDGQLVDAGMHPIKYYQNSAT